MGAKAVKLGYRMLEPKAGVFSVLVYPFGLKAAKDGEFGHF